MSDIKDTLFLFRDQSYLDFHSKLMPTINKDKIIGIRVPILRKYTAELYKDQEIVQSFMKELPHTYYEENNVHALLIEKIDNYENCIDALEQFLPYVDNWATCDIMNPPILAKHKYQLEGRIREWINSGNTYTVRFAVKMLMTYYLEEDFNEEYLLLAASINSEEYYVRMMIAWYYATALAKQYDRTIPYIEKKILPTWTHNKCIQKAIESRRITEERKKYLRTLKCTTKI